jgi:hypothetical protein
VTAPALRLDLPDDLIVVAARDEALLDVREVCPELAGWHEELVSAEAELVAVRVGAAPLSLVVALSPLPAGPDDVVLQGLRVLAAERIGADGEVTVLDLPIGSAVATADVAQTERGPAAIAVVQLPLPGSGRLLVLTLSAPEPASLPDCAALGAAVAMRVRAA